MCYEIILMGRAKTEYLVKNLKIECNLGLIGLLDQVHLLGYKYVKSYTE